MKEHSNAIQVHTRVQTWGNGLAIRVTADIAKAAGIAEGSNVRLHAEPGLITLKCEPSQLSLVLSMQRELVKETGRSLEAVLEMAITRMHKDLFPAKYRMDDSADAVVPGTSDPAPASVTLSPTGKGQSISDWAAAAARRAVINKGARKPARASETRKGRELKV